MNLYQPCPSCLTGSHVTYMVSGDEAREACDNSECDLFQRSAPDFDWKRDKVDADRTADYQEQWS